MPLDTFDKAILNIVQYDNLISHAKIGEKIGLSTSSVRRRLQSMKESGTIKQNVALVEPAESGVILLVSLSFLNETVEIYRQFEKHAAQTPEITQCYHVAGTYDYVLVVHGPSLQWYENWSQNILMKNENIKRYDTTVVWSCKKFKTQIEL